MKQAKKNSWNKLCEVLEENIWANAYRIAIKKLLGPINLTEDERKIVEILSLQQAPMRKC